MKLSDDDIRALVVQRFGEAMTDHEVLTGERSKALDYYYGRPLGNEIDGRSQVVTKDLMDTVEWLMPSLMRIFTTKQAVQFDPVGPEDEDLAKQESEYVSHVLWKQNDGFMLIYNWLKDALLQKVGYVKYWWEETEKVCYDNYTGLTQEQATLLITELEKNGEVEVVGTEVGHTAPGVPQTFDIRLKVTTKQGRLRVESVPPDETVVSGDCKGGVKNAKFAGSLRKITRSELMEMGFSRKEVEAVTDFTWTTSAVESARDEHQTSQRTDEGVDWATKEMLLLECFTKIDEDDDGYAELRHFLVHGDGFLIDEEADEVQLESWTPIPIPHRHAGIDMYDLTEDSQRINTGLTRGLLDNTYFSVNSRLAYNADKVNVNMLQVNRPGGHVAVKGTPVGEIVPIQPASDIAVRLLPVIEYFQMRREKATGIGEMTTGVDADVLAQSTKGAYLQASGASNQRIEAIARVFAETGLSSLYSSMHRMLMKHQDWVTRFKMKDQWVEVNPAEWQERANLSVSVGLGTAGKEEIRNNLGLMGQVMQTLAQVPGLVQAKNAYAFGRRMQTELGFEGEDFITDPSSPEYANFVESQTPPEDPYVAAKKIDAQTRLQEKQIDSRDKAMDRAQNRDLTITELEVKSGVDLAKAGIGAEVAASRGNNSQGPKSAGASEQRAVQ